MDRRTFIQKTSATGAALALPSFAIAQTKPFAYYSVNAFSGNFAVSGKFSDLGVRAAIKGFGNGLGRPIDYKRIDTEGNPAVAVRKVQQAIEQEKAQSCPTRYEPGDGPTIPTRCEPGGRWERRLSG